MQNKYENDGLLEKKEKLQRKKLAALGLFAFFCLAGAAVLTWYLEFYDDDTSGVMCTMTSPCNSFAKVMRQPIVYPVLYFSGNSGVLDVDLVVSPVNITFDWLTFTTRAFNGGIPGPTIMLKPGDRLNVNLSNQLPHNPDVITDSHVWLSVLGAREPAISVFRRVNRTAPTSGADKEIHLKCL